MQKSLAVIGSGPAGLMVAEVLSSAGFLVTVYEKRVGPARKLLIAGSSGLNITNDLSPAEFARQYSAPLELWQRHLAAFSATDWLRFIEDTLGLKTFLGTSGRYFVEQMHAMGLVRAWRRRLVSRGVQWVFGKELVDFGVSEGGTEIIFADQSRQRVAAVCLALGGASYEPDEKPLRWPQMLRAKGLGFSDFMPSNVGYKVAWLTGFLREAEGQPLKNVELTTARGSRRGDLMITQYGLEGTPVYTLGVAGAASIDLRPDLSAEQIVAKLQAARENWSPLRRAQKQLNLDAAVRALIFHHAPPEALRDVASLAALLKAFPVQLLESQSLDEAISSRGGLHFAELDEGLMLRKFPGIFAAGEMLDWDAPTGGFLIQGCVSQGFVAGRSMLEWLPT